MSRLAGAVILAAGASRRMGRAKLPLDLHGRPVLSWVVDCAFDAGLDLVVVVGGHAPALERSLAGANVLRVDGGGTQGESLAAGFDALPDRCRRAVVLLGDMPLVAPGTIRRMLDRQGQDQCDAAAADHDGAPGPPLVVDRSLFSRLAASDGPARQDVLAALGPRLARVRVPARELLDLDTPSDYDHMVRIAARCE